MLVYTGYSATDLKFTNFFLVPILLILIDPLLLLDLVDLLIDLFLLLLAALVNLSQLFNGLKEISILFSPCLDHLLSLSLVSL